MEPITADDPLAQSADVVADNLGKLRQLFPEAVTEGHVNFDVLRQLLGDAIDDGPEKYGLTWHGKRRARQLALTPSTGTLRPTPEESAAWDTTQNVLVEGDNLEVLKLLQKSYAGRVKLIYIDPPYNTGRDLLYPNDFSDGVRQYLRLTDQTDDGVTLVSNTESDGRYHANWLNLMYPRLLLARELLTDDGVLICTIDENEQTNLGAILKEVFNEGSYEHTYVTVVHNPRGIQGTNFSYTHEYAYFVYPRGQKIIGDRKIPQDEIKWSQFRNWGTESERSDAKNCFYPVYVRDGEVVGFGDVCPDDRHPVQTERDGDTFAVYPIDKNGVERKWRYARQSADSIKHLLRAKKTKGGYEIEIGKDFGTYRTVWTDKRYDANEYGTKVVSALVPDSPFSFPKSLWNVYDCLVAAVGDDKDAIVMDFFAGSGTTGHAVMELNKDDGGHRRYVLVQLPEPIESERYATIADVTAERLRGAGRVIQEENPGYDGDLGFRAYKLDTSNIRAWTPDPDDLEGTLADHVEHLVPGRTEQDVLVELLLKRGLDLCTPIETREIAGITTHSIGAGTLFAALPASVSRDEAESLAEGIAAWRDELDPAGDTIVVVRDAAFADDVAKSNFAAILDQRGVTAVRSL